MHTRVYNWVTKCKFNFLEINNIKSIVLEHENVIKNFGEDFYTSLEESIQIVKETILNKSCILLCGNGGSAADSQHFAAELVGRFKKDRAPFKAIALTTDSSSLTCIGNDYSFNDIFSRQLEALGNRGDLLVSISTSGNSRNIINAIHTANILGINTLSLLGGFGGEAEKISKNSILVPSKSTARIQEMHILVIHIICEMIEDLRL